MLSLLISFSTQNSAGTYHFPPHKSQSPSKVQQSPIWSGPLVPVNLHVIPPHAPATHLSFCPQYPTCAPAFFCSPFLQGSFPRELLAEFFTSHKSLSKSQILHVTHGVHLILPPTAHTPLHFYPNLPELQACCTHFSQNASSPSIIQINLCTRYLYCSSSVSPRQSINSTRQRPLLCWGMTSRCPE